ncbi:MAG: prephenate dehydratase [Candidatus Bathyarchaeia archaeon]
MPDQKPNAENKNKKIVAFQGEKGAYSESAVYSFFGPSISVKPCRDLAEVFESVETKKAEFGVVPVENSLEGSINQTYDLLLIHNLKVCGEAILKIDHCLITNPDGSLDSIKVVYSHPQALAQCRNFLERLGCDLIPTYDTAGSVKMLKEKKLKYAGAVASEAAALLYGMKILAREIADHPANYTRFFVLSEKDSEITGRDKTSIIFSTRHVPGALYKALEEFAKRNINLTKIESRPTRQRPWEYNFYLDFEGHRTEERCREALKALEERAVFLKILGSYPRADFSANSHGL